MPVRDGICPCHRKRCPRHGHCASCISWHQAHRYAPCCQSNSPKDSIRQCETLEALFDLWASAHRQEPLDSLRRTIPHNAGGASLIPAGNFIADGCFSASASHAKYLYILKEANLSRDGRFRVSDPQSALRWRREQSEDPAGRRIARAQNTKIARLFSLWLASELDIPKEEIAVITINKRGGYSICDASALLAYGAAYAPFLQKQIELLHPSYIICAAQAMQVIRQIYGVVEPVDYFEINQAGQIMRFLLGPHPAAWNIYKSFSKTLRNLHGRQS